MRPENLPSAPLSSLLPDDDTIVNLGCYIRNGHHKVKKVLKGEAVYEPSGALDIIDSCLNAAYGRTDVTMREIKAFPRLVIVTARGSLLKAEPVLFLNFQPASPPTLVRTIEPGDAPVRDVVMASCAAPGYFGPLKNFHRTLALLPSTGAGAPCSDALRYSLQVCRFQRTGMIRCDCLMVAWLPRILQSCCLTTSRHLREYHQRLSTAGSPSARESFAFVFLSQSLSLNSTCNWY